MLLVAKELATDPTLEVVAVAMLDIAVIAQGGEGIEHFLAWHTYALLVRRAHVIPQLTISCKRILTQRATETVTYIFEHLLKGQAFRRQRVILERLWVRLGTLPRGVTLATWRVSTMSELRLGKLARVSVRTVSRHKT